MSELLVSDDAKTTTASAGSPLRIGMVAPPWFELPPRGYGGTEAVVASLVDGLVDRGHEVVLVASGPHRTKATRYHRVYDLPPTGRLGEPAPEVVTAAEAARVLADADVDLVHDHTLAGPLLARGRRQPTVVTAHGPVAGEDGLYFEKLGSSVDIVAISDAQRRLNPSLNWVGTVHNAIDVSSFPYRVEKDDYVLWLGRFSPQKAPDLAIEAARAAGRRIVLAGKLNEAAERRYFEERVAPLLGPGTEYVGEADAALKRELLSGAQALVFPIQWEEPFGMVMIEAMACGTPVVALRRGSVPEVVADGVTGIIVDDAAQLPDAVARAQELDPAASRRHTAANFDIPVMAERYERVYRMLVEGTRSIRDLTGSDAVETAA